MVSTAAVALVDHPSEREIRFVRTVEAPIDLVWSIWSDPRHLHQWFGPTGYRNTTHTFEFRPGGEWRFTMHAPDGRDIPNRIVFRELLPPTRLVYENGWDTPEATLDFVVTWSFRAEGERRTRIEIVMTFADAAALKVAVERFGVNPGGPQTLARIAEHLAARTAPAAGTSDREIVTTRLVQAPRERVWQAWTDPEEWKRWWGPAGFTNSIGAMEVRSGGRWEFTMHGPDGTDYRNECRYLEVIAPRYLEWHHGPTPDFRASATFEEEGAHTRVTLRTVFRSPADLERAVRVFHAVEGARQTLDRLEATLALPAPLKQLSFVRVVKASREEAWKAWTTADALRRWFAPDHFTVPACSVDLRPGGVWTLTMRGPDGTDYPSVGEYLEVAPPERLVFLSWLNGADGRPMLVEHTEVLFHPAKGGTRVTVHTRVTEMTAEAASAVDGMDTGWEQTMDHFVTFVEG
jgi:uncharacterized protein YndB with AHSA1/START domain